MSQISFKATIIRELTKLEALFDKLSPDTKSNQGRLVSRAFVWDVMQEYAKKKSEEAWKILDEEEIIEAREYGNYEKGDYTLTETPSFSVQLKVSNPRKTFDPDHFSAALKKRFKVPEPATKEMVDKAKLPGNPVRTFTILER